MFAFFLSYALNANADHEMGIVTARYYESSNDKSYLNYSDFWAPSPAFSLGTQWDGPSNKQFKTMILRWRIADQFGTTWQKLAEYNSIANPNLIYVGQKIRIPK